MRQALEKALANPEPVPLVDVARQLHCDTTSMRRYFPELCRAIVTKYRERFDYAFVEQRLQEVLASSSETPAVYELAREMGYKRHIVHDKFPELCKQVSARRYAEWRRRREERMAGIRREIRRATSLLHEQDIYPSARRVFSMLNDPHVLRTKEGHEAWRLALEELGYPIDELKRYD
jgi:hypothetical protein